MLGSHTQPETPRIVLIRPGALGDALLTFPALVLLRRTRPVARVTLIATRGVLPLARESGLADATYPYDLPAWGALFAASPADADPLAHDVLAGAEVVAWLADPDGAVAANLRTLGAARVVVAPARPLPGDPIHMAQQLVRSLRPPGLTSVPRTHEDLGALLPALRVPREARQEADRAWQALGLHDADAPRVVALHPGSGGAAKRWPPESFAALAGSIRAWGLQPLLLEGPQDAAVCRAVHLAAEVSLPIARGLSVARLAALLQRCRAYVGNDSGVSHLAGLLGVPTLALFGPTDPAIWAPLGPRVHVLRASGSHMADLPVAQVVAALGDVLDMGVP